VSLGGGDPSIAKQSNKREGYVTTESCLSGGAGITRCRGGSVGHRGWLRAVANSRLVPSLRPVQSASNLSPPTRRTTHYSTETADHVQAFRRRPQRLFAARFVKWPGCRPSAGSGPPRNVLADSCCVAGAVRAGARRRADRSSLRLSWGMERGNRARAAHACARRVRVGLGCGRPQHGGIPSSSRNLRTVCLHGRLAENTSCARTRIRDAHRRWTDCASRVLVRGEGGCRGCRFCLVPSKLWRRGHRARGRRRSRRERCTEYCARVRTGSQAYGANTIAASAKVVIPPRRLQRARNWPGAKVPSRSNDPFQSRNDPPE
jgi:hypothetical protein